MPQNHEKEHTKYRDFIKFHKIQDILTLHDEMSTHLIILKQKYNFPEL